jgi:uncharacterized protein
MMRCKGLSLFLLASACAHQPTEIAAAPSLEDRFRSTYQKGHGGFDAEKKYLDPESIEFALLHGDAAARGMAQKTLLKNAKLIDPTDGGAFDYSLATDPRHPWSSPVRTKSLRTQAINLRLYSMAHTVFGGHRYLDAARSIAGYLESLAAEGGGYREVGEDRIPTRENGLVIAALVAYRKAGGERRALESAIAAADRMIAERSLPNGGFHDGDGALSFEATVAMLEAMHVLCRTTGDRRFVEEAHRGLDALEVRFADRDGGFAGAGGQKSIRLNVAVARAALWLCDAGASDHALRFLNTEEALSSTKDSAALLIVERELHAESLRLALR